MNAVEQFFYDNAGHSYNPQTETPEQGRERCARALAAAERAASERGFSFAWSVDDIDSSYFSDETPPHKLWVCVCRDEHGKVIGSLGGVDFGPDQDPWGQAYRRIVEAEVALEALD